MSMLNESLMAPLQCSCLVRIKVCDSIMRELGLGLRSEYVVGHISGLSSPTFSKASYGYVYGYRYSYVH